MGLIATPHQDFAFRNTPRAPLDISRTPVPYRCPCGESTLLLLPKFPGALVWRCATCFGDRRIDFKAAGEVQQEQIITGKLVRTPIEHTCQTCGERDVIALPLGKGEIRWECKCRSTWVIVFTSGGGRLAKVV